MRSVGKKASSTSRCVASSAWTVEPVAMPNRRNLHSVGGQRALWKRMAPSLFRRARLAGLSAVQTINFLPTLSPSPILLSPPAHETGANDHRDRLGAGGRCPRRGFFRRSARPGRPFAPPDRPPLTRGLRIGPLEAPQGPKSRQRMAPHESAGGAMSKGWSNAARDAGGGPYDVKQSEGSPPASRRS